MTEYWVSKKQYWCKYCNIYIRDDAPSRKHHETGLKHTGNKERFIRDLYKTGSMAKKEKIAAEAEMERINAAAETAYAKDIGAGHVAPGRLHPGLTSSSFASSSKPREKPKGDKWSNYTSAKDLGIEDLDTTQTSYEVEQEIKGRAARDVGAWEEVVEQPPEMTGFVTDGEVGTGGFKRKLGEYGADDDAAEGEDFKFAHRDKKPLRDPYAQDDWDPDAVLGKMKFKAKDSGASGSGPRANGPARMEYKPPVGEDLDREKWTGKLEMGGTGGQQSAQADREGLVFIDGGWHKIEKTEDTETDVEARIVQPDDVGESQEVDTKPTAEEFKPDVVEAPTTRPDLLPSAESTDDVKPDVAADSATPPPAAASSMFKKRRAPPGGRKK